MKAILLALCFIMLSSNYANADIKNGTIDGNDWVSFSDSIKAAMIVGYVVGSGHIIDSYPGRANIHKLMYSVDEIKEISNKDVITKDELVNMVRENNSINYLLMFQYSMAGIPIKDLVVGVDKFYSHNNNEKKLLAEALTFTKRQRGTAAPIVPSETPTKAETSDDDSPWYKWPLIIFSTLASIGQAASTYQPVNSMIQTPNAYGPGVHMDQYGRAVRVVPQ